MVRLTETAPNVHAVLSQSQNQPSPALAKPEAGWRRTAASLAQTVAILPKGAAVRL
jgi:hypothetical protein